MVNAQEIRRRREALKLSLSEAAVAAGWGVAGRTRWHDIESGRRKNLELRSIQAIAKVLNVTVNTLLEKS